MTIDINGFYLSTPMKRNEYMRIKTSDLPKDFIKQYKLDAKNAKDCYVYIKICKGMYKLTQARRLEQILLEQRLNEKGYIQSSLTPGFWKHDWQPIYFTLFVDGF